MSHTDPFRLLVDFERAARWLVTADESSRPLSLALPAALRRLRKDLHTGEVAHGMLATDVACLLGYLAAIGDTTATLSSLGLAPARLRQLIRRFGPSVDHATLAMAVAIIRRAHASGEDAVRAMLFAFGFDSGD